MKYLVVLLLLLIPTPAFASYTQPDLLKATNQARIAAHVPALKESERLDEAAAKAAAILAATQTFTHARAWKYLEGYPHSYAGQNLARRFTTTEDNVSAWLNSPSHRANLLSKNFTHTGIGMATVANGDIYVVQYFAKPNAK